VFGLQELYVWYWQDWVDKKRSKKWQKIFKVIYNQYLESIKKKKKFYFGNYRYSSKNLKTRSKEKNNQRNNYTMKDSRYCLSKY
jgi:hypothetical protein